MNYKLPNKNQRNFSKESSQEIEEMLKFKCEWLSLTSIKNRRNVKYIREMTHITKEFWMKAWFESILMILDV